MYKAGWCYVSCRGSHHKLRKGDVIQVFAYHATFDLGPRHLKIVSRDFGVPLDELRKLI